MSLAFASLMTTGGIGVASGAAAATQTPTGGYYGLAALVSAVCVGGGGLIATIIKAVLALRRADKMPSTKRGRAKLRRDLARQIAQLDALDQLDDEVEV